MKIAYGNYGMPTTPYETMIRQVAEIGYQGVEICVAPNYPTAPDALSAADRRNLRDLLDEHNLAIASFLVAQIPVFDADDQRHRANLELLRRIMALRADLGATVEVSSTLGGRIDDWDSGRDLLAARVHDWATTAASHGGIFAFEPHVGGIVNSPERARWLLNAVNHPNLKINFDYSHFELIDIPLSAAVDSLIRDASGVHVKDVQGRYPDFKFLLPGVGGLDYAEYLRCLSAAGYSGFVTVEISGQVFKVTDYDAVNAARFSYATLARAFEAAGIQYG